MDLGVVEDVIRLLQRSDVSELKVSVGGLSVKVKRGPQAPPVEDDQEPEALAPPDTQEPVQPALARVCAAMVGIYHAVDGLAPGSIVQPGQVVGLIESMKLMNELTASAGGRIVEMLVEDGSPVEYGQPLMTLMEET